MKYAIRAEAESLELQIYGIIGPDDGWGDMVSARSVVGALQDSKASNIVVRINSDGGDVIEGLAIYNRLVEHSAKKIIKIDSIAASMGSLIAMAGDEIHMPESSWMMVHRPWGGASGNAEDLREVADIMDRSTVMLASIYAKRTGLPIEKINELLAAETWMTGAEAKALGFATHITPAVRMVARLRPGAFVNLPKALVDAHARTAVEDPKPAPPETQPSIETDGDQMELLKAILAKLGMAEDAKPEDVMAALEAMLGAAAPPADAPKEDDEPAEIAALSRLHPVMQARVLAWRSKASGAVDAEATERATLIASNTNLITPALENWAKTISIVALREFVAKAPRRTPPVHEQRNDGTSDEPTADEINMCRITGTPIEAFKAERKREAALAKERAARLV
jgi:ATP-dependent protease ClpP protease subunit